MRPTLLVLLAAVCFGTTGTAVALGAPGASPLAVGAARVALGGVLLAAVAWRGSGPRWAAATARTRAAVVVGALGVVAYQPMFFAGTRAGGVAVGTVVALGSAPLATGLLGWLVGGERPDRRWGLATAVAVCGLVLLAVGSEGGGGGGTSSPLGLLASLGAGASYSVFALATKRLLEAGWGPTGSVGAVFGLAALLSVPVLVVTGLPGGLGGAATVGWLGVVTTALAYVLFSTGLRRLPTATVATLTLAEPLTATVLGLLLLGEDLGAVQALALALVAAGLAVLAVPGRRTVVVPA